VTASAGPDSKLIHRDSEDRMTNLYEDNPSLKSKLDTAIARAYRLALIEAERETGLPESTFDPVCPYSFSLILDDGFWPDGD
jgi:hypothetical protein